MTNVDVFTVSNTDINFLDCTAEGDEEMFDRVGFEPGTFAVQVESKTPLSDNSRFYELPGLQHEAPQHVGRNQEKAGIHLKFYDLTDENIKNYAGKKVGSEGVAEVFEAAQEQIAIKRLFGGVDLRQAFTAIMLARLIDQREIDTDFANQTMKQQFGIGELAVKEMMRIANSHIRENGLV